MKLFCFRETSPFPRGETDDLKVQELVQVANSRQH